MIWKQEDGYTEALYSFAPNLPPVLKLRAVKKGDGTFEAVVRDAQSGQMLNEYLPYTVSSNKTETLAQQTAIHMARSFVNL